MSTAFADYAKYYAAFYQDKDYAREADYVLKTLRAHGYRGGPILELGCGQGGHAIPLAKQGCALFGLDRSEGMIAEADRRRGTLPAGDAARLKFQVGDIRQCALGQKFSAAISLFHVISYLPTNEDLLAVFRNARAHLEPGALFAFDFWYGPAVLRDPPSARLKEARLDGAHILRRAAPEIDSAKNIVDVHYHFEVTPPGGAPPFSFSETHRMRYLFGTELELLCAIAGFEPVLLSEWLADPPAPPSSWNGYFMARAR